MSVLGEILVNVLTSVATITVLVFILKRYLEEWIASAFRKRNLYDGLEVEKSRTVSEFVLERQLGVYPEILEVLYRTRNIIREGMQKDNAYEWDPSLRALCAHLTENLYKYTFFMERVLFDKLHRFKHLAQDALLLQDMWTREERLFDTVGYTQQVAAFGEKLKEIDRLYDEITSELRKKFLER